MIPSRGPIQVRLEDTGGPRLQCKPPAQVKILRRPQAVSSNSSNQTNVAPVAAIDNRATHLDRFADSAFDDVTTDEFSPSNSLGHTSEQQNGIAKTRQLNYSTVAATSIRKVINSDLGTQINRKTTDRDRTKVDTRAPFNSSAPSSSATIVGSGGGRRGGGGGGTSTNNKKPLKTYQERADEYAKARLRILGSAFPENDDLTAPNDDDVNRILNF